MEIKKRNGGSSLTKRAGISYLTKEKGANKKQVIDWNAFESTFKFYKPIEGSNAINIIPFEIKSKNHPLAKSGEMEIGELDYCLDIHVHRNIGLREAQVLCLKGTYGKACPICEESDKLYRAGREKEAASLRSARRVFYNIEDVKNAPDEIQIFDVSHFLFEKKLISAANYADDDHEACLDFADPVTGSVIKFRSEKVKKGNFEFNNYEGFIFKKRNEELNEKLLKEAVGFDLQLNVPTYEEAQSILYGEDDDEAEFVSKEEKPKKTKGEKIAEYFKDDAGEKKGVENAGALAKKTREGVYKCPHGHGFGDDADGFEECDDCDMWDKCMRLKNATE